MRRSICLSLLCFCLALNRTTAADTAPEVTASQPVVREVTDYVDFTGRTEAVFLVNLVARTTGYLVKEPFKEGSGVKAGDLLFEIDPRPYQAQYDQAVSQVNLYKVQLKLAQVTQARDEQVTRATPGAVSVQQLDQDRAAIDQAMAQIKVAEASLETYKLNLDFCKVTSPIDGQVSRYFLTLGNLVTQDQTLLTTIVSLDPMYTYIDIDESTVLRVRRAINEGRIKPYGTGSHPIFMGLLDEDGFPHKGVVDFVNNRVDPKTGSVVVRGVFSNPLPPGGRRLLMPGMFARVRLPIGQPHKALLVVDRAIGSDKGSKYVYVVSAQGEIEYKGIETGPLESDGLRVVTKGLNANDQVLVSPLQKIRPGMKVQTEVVPMPLLERLGAAAGNNQRSGGSNEKAPQK